MTEVGSRMIPDILFQLNPAAVRPLDLSAIHTNWQYSAKIRQFLIPGLVLCALGLYSLRDVDAAAYVAEELMVLIEEWGTPVENPTVLSIMTPQSIFHLKWFPLPKCISVSGKAPLEIFRMNTLGPLV